jgi:hypothetical protein
LFSVIKTKTLSNKWTQNTKQYYKYQNIYIYIYNNTFSKKQGLNTLTNNKHRFVFLHKGSTFAQSWRQLPSHGLVIGMTKLIKRMADKFAVCLTINDGVYLYIYIYLLIQKNNTSIYIYLLIQRINGPFGNRSLLVIKVALKFLEKSCWTLTQVILLLLLPEILYFL